MPSGWTSTRLGNLGSLRKGRGGSRQDDDATGAACIRYGDLYKVDRPSMKNPVTRISTSSVEGYTQISRGDVLFALSGESQADIGKSSVSLIEEPTYCGGDTAVFSAIAISAEFLGHALTAPYLLKQKRQLGRGDIIVHISTGSLKQLTVLVPPAEEQAAIVKYLGHAHARIDRAIAAKRKMIALLEEQKQAIIHQAVTRGLDPSVPLKDSGIPWLGDIPVHWDELPLSRCFTGMVYGTSENAKGEGPITVIGMGDIQGGEVSVSGNGGLDRVPAGLELQAGDLLFNRTNSPNLVGKVGLYRDGSNQCVTFASYLVRLRPEPQFASSWLAAVLNSPDFLRFARGQALVSLHQANLNPRRYGRLKIPVPPPGERDAIAAAVGASVLKDDRAIANARREIELLQEFRTRLTSDVVTGQVDVRTIAASLPDLTDDVIADTDIDAELDDMLDSELDPEGTNG
ncbi:restriction endonuclease subunit S [Microbacterium profundi]|uniref:restriction endonuclease subunit S n=1 Tax=Microbacterium profundi TaxID=450380 RepID=UPI001F339AE3|nr:restriction endonuclease subunit S [Microbacterium profundi]